MYYILITARPLILIVLYRSIVKISKFQAIFKYTCRKPYKRIIFNIRLSDPKQGRPLEEKMKTETKENINIIYKCRKCGSKNTIIDEYNPEDCEGISEGVRTERELGNHGTFTCLDCGEAMQEYDN